MKTLSFDIDEVNKLFIEKKVFELRGIGNRLIREASLQNDYGKAELGVIAYALHKLETKDHFIRNPKWGKVKAGIQSSFEVAKNAAKSNDQQKFLESVKIIIQSITKIDDELGNFAQNIYEKAKVKQASLAYSYGLSISQAAALTGADVKEVQSYIGFTTMHDEEPDEKNISVRVNELRELLEVD
ncbi:MAG: hypothetical protein WCW44_04350 [archaeon]|jgi:hypothetical protein